jgi:ArsR family transcriptional regulator
MLEGVGMPETAGKTLTEDQVLLIAKAVGDRRRYEILKRLGERPDALACGAVRDCTGINPATLSHHMKELEIAGLVELPDKLGQLDKWSFCLTTAKMAVERERR